MWIGKTWRNFTWPSEHVDISTVSAPREFEIQRGRHHSQTTVSAAEENRPPSEIWPRQLYYGKSCILFYTPAQFLEKRPAKPGKQPSTDDTLSRDESINIFPNAAFYECQHGRGAELHENKHSSPLAYAPSLPSRRCSNRAAVCRVAELPPAPLATAFSAPAAAKGKKWATGRDRNISPKSSGKTMQRSKEEVAIHKVERHRAHAGCSPASERGRK